MEIGFVLHESAKINGRDTKWFDMHIRPPGLSSFRATMTHIKEKSSDNAPDWHIMHSFNRRGESYERVRIGSLWKRVSEKGNPYLSGYIESPAFPTGKIHISVVTYKPFDGQPSSGKKYNILWSPPRDRDSDRYEEPYAPPVPTPTASYQETAAPKTPEISIEIDDDIPF